MALVKWKSRNIYDPWADFKSLQNEINELFNYDRSPKTTGLFDRSFAPAVDFIENDNEYTITCEMPGMEQKDIEVSIASNVLTIKGIRKDEKEEKTGKFYKKEILSGSFQRTIPLPAAVESEKIAAQLENGFLSISIPKKEESKPKQININIQ
jgi:HSP20 family protein